VSEDARGNVVWVECGRIGRPLGLRGECAVYWNSGTCPVEIGGELFLVKKGEEDRQSYRVAALREQGRLHVVRFEGVADRTAAQDLRGAALSIPSDRLPALPQGEYYSFQILGLEVLTEDGRSLGRVVRIFSAGENDVYEVLPEEGKRGEEILIPATSEVILSVDLKAGRIMVRPLEGMLDS
jgi:16S rRNA processing protein RimM